MAGAAAEVLTLPPPLLHALRSSSARSVAAERLSHGVRLGIELGLFRVESQTELKIRIERQIRETESKLNGDRPGRVRPKSGQQTELHPA